MKWIKCDITAYSLSMSMLVLNCCYQCHCRTKIILLLLVAPCKTSGTSSCRWPHWSGRQGGRGFLKTNESTRPPSLSFVSYSGLKFILEIPPLKYQIWISVGWMSYLFLGGVVTTPVYLIHQIFASLSALKKSTFTRHYHIKIFHFTIS